MLSSITFQSKHSDIKKFLFAVWLSIERISCITRFCAIKMHLIIIIIIILHHWHRLHMNGLWRAHLMSEKRKHACNKCEKQRGNLVVSIEPSHRWHHLVNDYDLKPATLSTSFSSFLINSFSTTIYIHKAIENCAISSTAADRIVVRPVSYTHLTLPTILRV